MAEAIKHSVTTSLATTGLETAKGGILGALAVGLIGAAASALLVGGAIVGVAAIFGAAAAAVVPAVVLGSAAGVLGGAASLVGGGTVGGALGVIMGFVKGRSRVGAENRAYENKAAHENQTALLQQRAIAEAGMQQGYALGFQEGQMDIVGQIQQAQMAQNAGSHAAKCTKCDSKVETLAKQRQAQAANGPQVG